MQSVELPKSAPFPFRYYPRRCTLVLPVRLRTRFANVPHNVVVSLSVVLVRVLALLKASLQTRSLQTRVGKSAPEDAPRAPT